MRCEWAVCGGSGGCSCPRCVKLFRRQREEVQAAMPLPTQRGEKEGKRRGERRSPVRGEGQWRMLSAKRLSAHNLSVPSPRKPGSRGEREPGTQGQR